ncbi:hypothetical protein EST38_g12638 [Candolleomyces aberdarensis]|uniref:Uncharacterized protein n=1 Tax=Candolleomyces aberdarensis TaxID=2316362 RepID=A0A4Q2D3Y7_9AGAR|nr:hypothetical protein EST38_g12638 [Candolleomyces aberdarensis]
MRICTLLEGSSSTPQVVWTQIGMALRLSRRREDFGRFRAWRVGSVEVQEGRVDFRAKKTDDEYREIDFVQAEPPAIAYCNSYPSLIDLLAYPMRLMYSIKHPKFARQGSERSEQEIIAELDAAMNEWAAAGRFLDLLTELASAGDLGGASHQSEAKPTRRSRSDSEAEGTDDSSSSGIPTTPAVVPETRRHIAATYRVSLSQANSSITPVEPPINFLLPMYKGPGKAALSSWGARRRTVPLAELYAGLVAQGRCFQLPDAADGFNE